VAEVEFGKTKVYSLPLTGSSCSTYYNIIINSLSLYYRLLVNNSCVCATPKLNLAVLSFEFKLNIFQKKPSMTAYWRPWRDTTYGN